MTFVYQSFSQKIPLFFESYTTENGLPQNDIGKIVQDKAGFIWMTSGHGLSRFDGNNFVNFKHETNNINSLAADFLTDVVVDSDNGLWIASIGKGLTYYNQEQDQFIRFYDERDSSSSKYREITSLFIDRSNKLWIGSTKGIYCSKMDLNLFLKDTASFNSKFDEHKLTDEKQITLCIYEDPDKNIWIGTNKGLFIINKESKVSKQLSLDKQEIRVNSFASTNNNFIYIGTDEGLFEYNKKTNESVNILKSEVFTNFDTDLKIEKLIFDKEGNLWIGTYGKGLIHYNKRENIVYQYSKSSNNKIINDNIISSFFIDKSNTLFIGVHHNGIYVTKIRKNHFQRFRNQNSKNSISSNSIWDMYTVSNNEIWICTQNGLNKFDPKTRKFNYYFIKSANKLAGSTFLFIKETGPNHLFLSSKGIGLVLFDKVTKTFKNLDWARNENLDENLITGFYEKNDNNLWISYFGKGIIEFNKRGKIVKEINNLPNNYVRGMYSDTQGRLWAYSWGNGLYLYDFKDESFKVFTKNNGLGSDFINCIHEDTDGYLWLGTSSGLTKFDPETYKAKPLIPETKTFDEEIYSIQEDDKNNLWVSTNNGLFKINKNTGNLINFNIKDGLQSNEFNHMASAKTPDGHMLFGGVNGFNYFHPDSILQSNFKPQIAITAFLLHYNDYKKGDKYKKRIILDKTIEYIDTIKLKHNENIIELNFSALDYFDASEIEYKYRLLGFKNEWVYTDAEKRFASYTNLKPGNYIFQLKSTNSEGVWNDNIKQLYIIIKPAFWQTTLFKLFSLLILLFAIYVIVKIRTRWLLIQQNKLKELVKIKTNSISEINSELEEQTEELNQLTALLTESNKSLGRKVKKRTRKLKKALNSSENAEKLISSFLSNLSHEIRTPMNAINGFSQLISDDDLDNQQRIQYCDIINTNVDSLLILIDNIMSISKLHTGNYTENNFNFLLDDLFQELYFEFKNSTQIKGKNIDFTIGTFIANNKLTLYSDRDILKQIVYQLLDNAIKYTEKGSVSFGYFTSLTKKETINLTQFTTSNVQSKKNRIKQKFNLIIFIEDTGVGIDEKLQKTAFNTFTKGEQTKNKLFRGTGVGLALVKSLTDRLNGKVKLKSQVGVGTKVTITIPLFPK